MSRYRCKSCGVRVELNFDHVGPTCGPESNEDECSGTFWHRSSRSCSNAGRDLTHEMVEGADDVVIGARGRK